MNKQGFSLDRLGQEALKLGQGIWKVTHDVAVGAYSAGERVVGTVSTQVNKFNETVRAENAARDEYRERDPDGFAKNWHVLGMEAAPTQIKYAEAATAVLLGINGVRATWYGLNAATDKIAEKGQPAGFFRNVSGYLRAAMGVLQVGIAAAVGLHAFNISPPSKITLEGNAI